ncbi:uncharacterized protein CBL_04680 [Carabus blaptoides fortunei]
MFAVKYLLFFTSVWFSFSAADNVSTLELVHIFFRHGDRTPDKKDFYPTDPYKDYPFYPMGLGQLTNQGKSRCYNLGTMLRRRYDDFLGEIYTPEALTASSTDFDRTKMSLLLVLAGLWPPASIQQWNQFISWQPIPINYKPKAYDYLIQRPNDYCPRYLKELQKVLESQDVQNFLQVNRHTFKYVEKWTEKLMEKPIDLFNVYQNLNSEASQNLTLPQWTKLVYPEPLHSLAGMQCSFENYNDILIRLNGGHHLKLVIESGKAKIKGELLPKGRKMYLTSGHENNVVNVLTALNLFTAHVPTFSSAVIIELHRLPGTEQYGYKIFHHNQTRDDPYLLTVPGCSELCPFDKFVTLISNHIPGNYTAECDSEINLD